MEDFEGDVWEIDATAMSSSVEGSGDDIEEADMVGERWQDAPVVTRKRCSSRDTSRHRNRRVTSPPAAKSRQLRLR